MRRPSTRRFRTVLLLQQHAIRALAAMLVALLSGNAAAVPTQQLTAIVSAGGETYQVNFERMDTPGQFSVLHPNFEAWVQTADGSLTAVSRDSTHHGVYIGRLPEAPGAIASALYTASTDELVYQVIFADGTHWVNEGDDTEVRTTAPLTENWAQYVPEPGAASVEVLGSEIGVDLSSRLFVDVHNSDVDTALAWTEYSVVNANLVFLPQTGVYHRIGRVVLRGAPNADPYRPLTNHVAHLNALRNQWRNVLPPGTHNAALVVRSTQPGGVANVGTFADPGFTSNGATARGDFSRPWRHEVAHNMNVNHFDGGAPEGQTLNSGNSSGRFSGPEQALVQANAQQNAALMQNLGLFSLPSPPRASSDQMIVSAQLGSAVIDVLANDFDVNGDVLSLVSFDATSATGLGGTLSLAPGAGADGRDALRYTAPTVMPTSAVDRFTYRIRDASGQEALGYIFVRLGDFQPTLDYTQDFGGLPDGFEAFNDGSFISRGTVGTGLAIRDERLFLADSVNGELGSYALPVMNVTSGFEAYYRYRVSSPDIPAHGFAFNYGASSATLLPTGTTGAFLRGLTVDFDTSTEGAGFNIWIDNQLFAASASNTIVDGQWHDVSVLWNPTDGLTLQIDDVTIYDQLDVSAVFTPEVSDALAFSARNALGRVQTVEIDDIVIRPPAVTDSDSDGVSDDVDNCTLSANPDQRDTDADGFGNACDADLNDDCTVNFIDLGIFRGRIFSNDEDADFNGDGVVNFIDLGIFRGAAFTPPGPSAGVGSCSF